MTETRYRRVHDAIHGLDAAWKTALAITFAGLTALGAQVALPVPWTPVPVSFQVLAVYLTGAYLGPRYGLLSMGIYLLAGAIGLHVFAPSNDAFNQDLWNPERWRILVPDAVARTGFTAGYLLGFPLAALFIGGYMRRREAGLDSRWTWGIILGLLALLGIVAIGSLFLRQGTFAGDDAGHAYQSGADAAWVAAAAFLVLAPLLAFVVLRWKGHGREALNLYLVILASTALIHVPGIVVLKSTLGFSWSTATALGSTVFLPIDAVKAAIAVALSLPFLPSPPSESEHA